MSGLHFEFKSVLMKALRGKVRNSSIRLLKVYVQLIQGARSLTLAVMALAAVTTLAMGGFLLLVVGLFALIPMERETFFFTLAAFGGLVCLMASVTLWVFFREKNWLQKAGAYELMELALPPRREERPDSPLRATKPVADVELASKRPDPVPQMPSTMAPMVPPLVP